MARTALANQAITTTPLNPTLSAANVDGNWVTPDTDYIEVLNGSGGALHVEIPFTAGLDGAIPDPLSYSIPASGRRKIKLGTPAFYLQTGNVIYLNYPDGVSSLTIGAFKV